MGKPRLEPKREKRGLKSYRKSYVNQLLKTRFYLLVVFSKLSFITTNNNILHFTQMKL